jgi:hypothetical protein
MNVIRARVRAYDRTTHTATVEPVSGPAALLAAVPVSMAIRGGLLSNGREVALLTWDDVNALIVGVYGGVPSIPSGRAYNAAAQSVTTAWTTLLTLSLTLVEEGYFWAQAQLNGYALPVRAAHWQAALFVDGATVQPPLVAGCPLAYDYFGRALVVRTPATYAVGAHTLELRAALFNAGDTAVFYALSLQAVAEPANPR